MQETTAKAAVEKAKESAKAAHAQEDKIVAELVRNSLCLDQFIGVRDSLQSLLASVLAIESLLASCSRTQMMPRHHVLPATDCAHFLSFSQR